ncbi:MAG: YkgJ family cysteine cluster protein [Desulfobacteraceae bacterium]|nr:YkgJ family cysteine cluster protein [Desulfobacteraceae bacterium]
MNFEPFFKQYEQVVKQVDAAFEKVRGEYESCVKCKIGCSDCCNALFDLTLIEALYIKSKFNELVNGELHDKIIESANIADRKIYKLKRQAYKEHEDGKSENEILSEMAKQRMRCPGLNDNDQCLLYSYRPITCRLYGIPAVIGERALSCGLSGFKPGTNYPTVKMDKIYQSLYKISFSLTQEINSKYPNLWEMLVPLSMALLTDYTEQYLGVKTENKIRESEK